MRLSIKKFILDMWTLKSFLSKCVGSLEFYTLILLIVT